MQKINFKRIAAKNFLCFGDDGIELNFANYGNIILVKGVNLDSLKKGEEERLSSNGSGKSSIPEIIVYGLFGKTIKSPKKISHKDIMHINCTKGLSVEVCWDDYKVERKRKPDSLRFWKNDNELTLGGMPATQKLIEDTLGLNYQTFTNIFVFTDDNSNSFLECDAAEKRSIVENLLSLEKYRGYHETAKSLAKDHASSIKTAELELSHIESNIKNLEQTEHLYKEKLKLWKSTKITEIKSIASQLDSAEKELESLNLSEDVQKFEEAQKQLSEATSDLETYKSELAKLQEDKKSCEKDLQAVSSSKTKLLEEKHEFVIVKQNYVAEGKKINEVLSKIDKLEPGVNCQHCFAPINPDNYATIKQEHESLLKDIKVKYSEADAKCKDYDNQKTQFETKEKALQEVLAEKLKQVKAIEKKQKDTLDKISVLNKIQIPDNTVKKAGVEEKIRIIKETSKKALTDLENGCPYTSLIEDTHAKITQENSSLSAKQVIINDLKTQSEYYAFWTIAFGDSGIRKYIIDEVIPALNANVNYWLQFLIDSKIEINFDNELSETILKFPDRKPLIYHIMSNGQRRRINLALSQAFAHVMTLNTGRMPSLVFLDEVTTNIDPVGVEGIYNMICELAKEKQVVVTTHDHDLLELLNGCQELNLQMKNGTSILV